MGKSVARDIFPSLVEFMDRHGRRARGRAVQPRAAAQVHEDAAPAMVH
jgi:hypothetical protein